MRILGLDPGTANCGFAMLDTVDGAVVVRDLGCLTSDKDAILRARVAECITDVHALMLRERPSVVVAEAPAYLTSVKAQAMLWSAFAGITGLCTALSIPLVLRNPGEWRRLLKLPVQRASVDAVDMDALSFKRAKEKAAALAQAARKASTVELMRSRWPGAVRLLESTPRSAHEHAWDALAIATSWTDKATDTPKQAAQADLFTP